MSSYASNAAKRWPGRVLFISPHTMYFLGDQLRAVGDLVDGVEVLIPSPILSGLVVRLPYTSNRYASLKRARDSTWGNILRPRYLDFPGPYGRGVTSSQAARSSIRAISKTGVGLDIIHSHFIGLDGLIGIAVKERFRKPLVVTAYGGDAYSLPFRDSYRKGVAVSVVKGADGLIAVSRPIASILVDLGADRKKVRVIPTGYDGSVFKPMAKSIARSQLGLPPSKRILLTVANLVAQKGHSYLLESFGRIAQSRGDLLLVVVGGGELAHDLRLSASKLGHDVLFAGPRPHEEIAKWMNACDVFVLPSVSEGSPTVLPEAMACGRPVVATTVGGIPDLVADGEVGYLVPPRDVNALSDALIRALDRNWDEEEIRKHALPFSWDGLAGEIVKVYSEVSGT